MARKFLTGRKNQFVDNLTEETDLIQTEEEKTKRTPRPKDREKAPPTVKCAGCNRAFPTPTVIPSSGYLCTKCLIEKNAK